MAAQLEHTNITVTDIDRTAAWMMRLFDWRIRWDGASKDGGRSVHVGTPTQYIALYQPARSVEPAHNSYVTAGGLNHIAVVVDDLDEVENAVLAEGFKPVNHGDYEPGRRFYFHDHDDIEFEIVDYG